MKQDKLVLRYNATVPGIDDSTMPKILALIKKFEGLEMQVAEELAPGKKIKVLSISGNEISIGKMRESISRMPAVTIKSA